MRFQFPVGFTLMTLLLSIPVMAETENTLSLVSNSPFLPPGFQPPGTPGQPATPPATSNQYEFRGVYQLSGTYYYNLYDVRERKGSWVTKQDANEKDMRILSFDRESNELAIDVAGKTLSLALVETSDRTLPVQTAQATAQPAAKAATTPTTKQPVRRRVIRPTSRASRSSSPNTARRRVIRPPQ
ncbi:hypothetical protein G0Q06_08565 [Puniceicoccales bacterium CK1056]|uniref:Uncharacterized protein n=1 Tax=Oceanipulchritudo coccoides TaxID=2706888 RepID=A0A6B2M4D3_9BACT|nr:hypothetical protein [Oceanipulchritudo coccoides]NDV62500.1 hypothetical protein [Oceanipulchritudo coccoides]